jgi:regulator of sigma E protease
MATNAAALGVTSPGLKPGDRLVRIDDDEPLSFNDLVLASAMARSGTAVSIDVRRSGVEGTLHFSIVPIVMPSTKMLYIGAGSAASDQLLDSPNPAQHEALQRTLDECGIPGLKPGMTLERVSDKPVETAYDLVAAVEAADGHPVPAVFTDDSGTQLRVDVPARPRMMRDRFMVAAGQAFEAKHLLGIMPVLAVDDVVPGEGAAAAGLQAGDVFVRIGATEWPSIPSGVAEIRAASNATVRMVVTRKNKDGLWIEHDLGDVKVSSSGRVGFQVGDSSDLGSWVGTAFAKADNAWSPPPLAPGSRIIAVNGHPTGTLLDVREQLRLAAVAADGAVSAELTVERPLLTADGSHPIDEIAWKITPESRKQLTTAAWEPALDPGLFAPEEFELKAAGPLGAIGMGLRETQRVMMTTYVTFARLFQGSIKVEHLKGPVGIAHTGTILAERGPVWLLFFMALISVNLAVINFLPIPIADGGHFVFLLYEQFTGKPVSAAVQNFAAIAGLILLATVFLVVTFNDISNLFKG